MQDYLLSPGTLVKPKSFIGLMSLYDSNYFRLNHLIPELHRLDGYFRSRVAGDCDLHVEILERSRYTVTMALSYFFEEEGERIADPDMKVRVYLDGQFAEPLGFAGEQRHAAFRRLSRMHRAELDTRWRRNIILNKWLEYLMDQGHLILER